MTQVLIPVNNVVVIILTHFDEVCQPQLQDTLYIICTQRGCPLVPRCQCVSLTRLRGNTLADEFILIRFQLKNFGFVYKFLYFCFTFFAATVKARISHLMLIKMFLHLVFWWCIQIRNPGTVLQPGKMLLKGKGFDNSAFIWYQIDVRFLRHKRVKVLALSWA